MGCKSVLFFYGCPKQCFPDVEVNPGPRVAHQCCRVMFTNINGLHGKRDELAIAATKFDVVACAKTKVTGRRHLSELLLPGFKAPTLLLRGARPNEFGMALFIRSSLSVSRSERFKCSCCEFMVAKIPGQQLNCYLFVVYRSPSTDDRVFNCLCEAMGSIQSVDPKSVFLFCRWFQLSPDSPLRVAGIMRSLMPMVWLLLISPLLLTVLNWLMDPLIGLEVCWIWFWQIFRIYVMFMFMAMLVGQTMRRLELHCWFITGCCWI